MIEIVFLIEEAPKAGLSARALGESIFTHADSIEALRDEVRGQCAATSKNTICHPSSASQNQR